MASLPLVFGTPANVRMAFAATATKGASGSSEEKSLLDWVLGNLTKQDQFYETDPILKKVEEKSGTGKTTSGRKGGTVSVPTRKSGTVSVPSKKKNGGLGGLFAKN